MPTLWPTIDAGTRRFWRTVGRPVDLDGEHAWLRAPSSEVTAVDDAWLHAEAARTGGRLAPPTPDDGLLPSLDALTGPDLDASRVLPEVRDFYEHTASWRMDVWSQWSPLLAPGGALVTGLFGRRVRQLALPIQPLEVSRGMTSSVRRLDAADGAPLGSLWLRTLRATGSVVFAGWYRTGRLPGLAQPQVHVTFPLERGNVQVYLTPQVLAGGEFVLTSPPGPFGAPGAYVTALVDRRWWACRVAIHERFHLYLDEGELRTDHRLDAGRLTALRLHYRLTRHT